MYNVSLRVKDSYPVPEIEVGRWTYDNEFGADLQFYRLEQTVIEKGHDCFNAHNDKLGVTLALYDDNDKKIKERHNYIYPETFYSLHRSYITTSEGLNAMNRYRCKQRKIKIVLRTFAAIVVALICWGVLSIKYMGSGYLDGEKTKEKVTWDTNRMHYDTDAATLSLTNDIMLDSVEVKKWQGNLGGDTAKCRKIFLQNMKAIYSQKCFERNPARIECEIKGNTLYMYSHSFRDEMAAMFAQDDFYQYITDCDFDTVRVFTHKGGGAKGWRIYVRGDQKYSNIDRYEDKVEYPKMAELSLFDEFFRWGRNQAKIQAHDKAVSEYFGKAHIYDSIAEVRYRKHFIEEKTELYKHRKNK